MLSTTTIAVGGGTPKVQYQYANGANNIVRPFVITYPDSRNLTMSYSGTDDDALNRVGHFWDDDGSTHLADYTYFGLGSVVKVDYPDS